MSIVNWMQLYASFTAFTIQLNVLVQFQMRSLGEKKSKATAFQSGLKKAPNTEQISFVLSSSLCSLWSDDKLTWTVPITVLLKKEVLTWASAKSYRSSAWFPDSSGSKTILQKMPKFRAILQLLVETRGAVWAICKQPVTLTLSRTWGLVLKLLNMPKLNVKFNLFLFCKVS